MTAPTTPYPSDRAALVGAISELRNTLVPLSFCVGREADARAATREAIARLFALADELDAQVRETPFPFRALAAARARLERAVAMVEDTGCALDLRRDELAGAMREAHAHLRRAIPAQGADAPVEPA